MEQDNGEEVETVLAQHMVRLFKHDRLTAAQAKILLDKMRLLVDAGAMGDGGNSRSLAKMDSRLDSSGD
jgi:hypothetical protein